MSLSLRLQWWFWDAWRALVGCRHPVMEPVEEKFNALTGESVTVHECTLCFHREERA